MDIEEFGKRLVNRMHDELVKHKKIVIDIMNGLSENNALLETVIHNLEARIEKLENKEENLIITPNSER